MTLVLDGSVTLAWFFEDERTPALDALLDRVAETGATVPSLWRLEVANGLLTALRRKRIDAAYRDTALERLGRMAIVIDADTAIHAWKDTLRLADEFGLSLYDATYLELAKRLSLPLASLDARLSEAASRLGVALLGKAEDRQS